MPAPASVVPDGTASVAGAALAPSPPVPAAPGSVSPAGTATVPGATGDPKLAIAGGAAAGSAPVGGAPPAVVVVVDAPLVAGRGGEPPADVPAALPAGAATTRNCPATQPLPPWRSYRTRYQRTASAATGPSITSTCAPSTSTALTSPCRLGAARTRSPSPSVPFTSTLLPVARSPP